MKYINHLTITTGDLRRSYRSEVSDNIVEYCKTAIGHAIRERAKPVPLMDTGLSLAIGREMPAASGCLMATLYARKEPIVVFGVAPHNRCGKTIMTMLVSVAETVNQPVEEVDTLPAPWCAALITAPAETDAMIMAGDAERCIAWAWLER